MKSKRGCGLLPWLVAAISMLMLRPGMLLADDGTTMALALNAGESYVINNVSPGETPAVSVITNPHALVVHNEEPGKVVLLGAEAGEWTVSVKTTDGSTVKYDVTVKSVGSVYDINNPAQSTGTDHWHRRDHGHRGAGSGQDGCGHRSGCFGFVVVACSTYTTTTDTVAAASSSAPATAPVMGVPTPPAPISHSSFDFAPSVPAASYATTPPAASSQTASASLSNERYRVDPSVSLNGGELHSGAVTGGRHYLPEDGVQLQTGILENYRFCDQAAPRLDRRYDGRGHPGHQSVPGQPDWP